MNAIQNYVWGRGTYLDDGSDWERVESIDIKFIHTSDSEIKWGGNDIVATKARVFLGIDDELLPNKEILAISFSDYPLSPSSNRIEIRNTSNFTGSVLNYSFNRDRIEFNVRVSWIRKRVNGVVSEHSLNNLKIKTLSVTVSWMDTITSSYPWQITRITPNIVCNLDSNMNWDTNTDCYRSKLNTSRGHLNISTMNQYSNVGWQGFPLSELSNFNNTISVHTSLPLV
ncbi:hypothetical protein [Capnocytophaga canis]|uniref:Uncharacterized protein n=1 Tax=Capnocytophaga canis TaxID=1848903 RepID=A0A0B7ITF7_9FLAO|nr:hypothetical protein [Capnocytophaga canis]CEN53372.1 hypothetical protein CCAND93_410002 [Capnocytophaga canis]